MTGRNVTLLDVAHAAGVSRSTASDALQGSGRVAEATRARVREVADALDYRPNSAARRLRRAKTSTIGLYLPPTATRLDYYMTLAFGAVARAQEDGLDVVLLGSRASAHGPLASRMDGLLVIDPEPGDTLVPTLLEAGIPVVTGELYPGASPMPYASVVCDNAALITALLDHVADRGARRPALLAPGGESAWAQALRAGATAWSADRGIPVIVLPVPFAATPYEVAAATRSLLTADPSVDAVISGPDGSAPGILQTAQSLGRTAGRDLLVAACVDGTAARTSRPAITAVDLHPHDYGRACTGLLSEVLTGTSAPDTVRRHRWTLRVRASTGGEKEPRASAG
ncbi:LacI family DNA-binding transcriptional regulator [Streptomyces sp. NPDC051561]|uniref:LacI family DNA-binding transcriptional regulator n=1 Tax=Streptomyces sp. NPDC051561 TaxID=3365658 RepID=UPI00379035FB